MAFLSVVSHISNERLDFVFNLSWSRLIEYLASHWSKDEKKKKIDDAMSLSFSRLIIFHKSNKKHNVSDDFSHEEFVLVQYCFLPNTIWKCQQKQPTDILSFSLSLARTLLITLWVYPNWSSRRIYQPFVNTRLIADVSIIGIHTHTHVRT